MSYEVPSDERDQRLLRKEVAEQRDLIRFTPQPKQNDTYSIGAGSRDTSTGVIKTSLVLNPEVLYESVQISWTGGAGGELQIGHVVNSSVNNWKGKFLYLVSGDSTAGTGVFEPIWLNVNTPPTPNDPRAEFSDTIPQTLTNETVSGWTASYTNGSKDMGNIVPYSASLIIDKMEGGDPNINVLHGAKNNGQVTTVKPKEGKTLTLSTGGNIDILSDVTINDNEIAVLQYHEDAGNNWLLLSGGGGGSGAYKAPVRVASTGNNITHPIWNETIDGVTVVEGDRILIKDQSTGADNGIYVMGAITLGTGTVTRASDFADSATTNIAGSLTPVNEGTTNLDTVWMCTTNEPLTVGTTALSFSDITGGVAGGLNTNLSNMASPTIPPVDLNLNGNNLIFDATDTQRIIANIGGIGIQVPTGDTIDFFINDLVTPVGGWTETDFNSNVPIFTFGVDTNSIVSFYRDYDVDSPAVDDLIGKITFEGHDNLLNAEQFGSIGLFTDNVTNGSEAGRIQLQVVEAGGLFNSWILRSDNVVHKNELQTGNADPLEYIFFRDNTGGAVALDELGQIRFDGLDTGSNQTTFGEIVGISNVVTNGSEVGSIEFKVRDNPNLTTAYTITGDAGAGGQPQHDFEGHGSFQGLNNSASVGVRSTHAVDPDNALSLSTLSGASNTPEIITPNGTLNVNVGGANRLLIDVNVETIAEWVAPSGGKPQFRFYRDDTSTLDNEEVGEIFFYGRMSDGANTKQQFASIKGIAEDVGPTTREGEIRFDVADTLAVGSDALTTYFRVKPFYLNPDSTRGANVSEVPLVTQTLYPNTGADIGHTTSRFLSSYINDMYGDKVIFGATTSPSATENSIGADATGMWLNIDDVTDYLTIYENGTTDMFRFGTPSANVYEMFIGPQTFTAGEGYKIQFGEDSNSSAEIKFTQGTDNLILNRLGIATTKGVELQSGGVAKLRTTSTSIQHLVDADLVDNDIINVVNIKSNGGGGATTGTIGELITADGGFNYFVRDTIAWESDANLKIGFSSSGINIGSNGVGDDIVIQTLGATSDVNVYGTGQVIVGLLGTNTATFSNSAVTLSGQDLILTNGAEEIQFLDEVAGSTVPTPSAGNITLFNDLTTGDLSVKKSSGTVVDLEAVGGSNHNLLSATHTDTTTGTVARGDIITGQGTSATWTRLAKGTANQVLSMDGTGTDVVWANASSGDEFADDVFRIIGSVTPSKKLAFEVDGITASTTRTITVKDASGDLPLLQTSNTWSATNIFNGTNTTIGSASSDNLTLNAQVTTSIIPDTDGDLNLGSASLSWDRLYASAMYFEGTDAPSIGTDALYRATTGDIVINVGGTDDFFVKLNGTDKMHLDTFGSLNLLDSFFYEAQGSSSTNYIRMGVVDTSKGGINTNATLSLRINNVEQVIMTDGVLRPASTNDIDLGTTSLEYKDMYLTGTAHIDILDIDETSTFNGNATFNEDVTLGSSNADNITFNGDTVGSITPNTTETDALGGPSNRWDWFYLHDAIDWNDTAYTAGQAPANTTGRVKLFVRDESGTQQLRVKFESGTSKLIATE